MMRPAPEHDIPSDFTSQISDKLRLAEPCESGSFGVVYQCTISTSEGTKEVAVKVFKIYAMRTTEKHQKAIRRELKVWLRLSKHPAIVPLLGIAYVGSSFPALVSQWMPSGTLYMYLEQGTITDSAKVGLVLGIADGLKYLHSEDVVHGDLHPANVLVDHSGYPRLTDFGLATVVGDAELQLNTTTANRSLDPRWRAPEVVGIHSDGGDPVQPNFQSDVYSFGGVMFFIISGNIPWKEKKTPHQIIAALLQRATPASPNHILDDHWNLIRKCWSWDPADRPKATEITIATRSVVVFGETGVGKSSLINLMAGEEVANISPDIQRCTMHWQEYTISFGGDSYKVFDTVGLEEPGLGIKGYLETVENAYRLVKALDREGGIDLLLFCVRAGRLTATLQSNYRLFHEFLCEKKVPIVLVITGLEREKRMEDWWNRNKRDFEKFRIQVAGHACITAASGLDGRQKDLYEESRIIVRNLVQQFTADGQRQAWIGADNRFKSFILKLKELLIRNLHLKKKNIASHLMKRCGISKEVAQQLVGMMKQE